jgi:endonuclease/exonuclease/phosphatase family metal-dependent hydrolase
VNFNFKKETTVSLAIISGFNTYPVHFQTPHPKAIFRKLGLLNLLKLLTLAILVMITASTAFAGSHTPINVATYNLRLNTPDDGTNIWGLRKEAVKALIQYHEFDLFGTQEGQPEQIKDLEAMSEYGHEGVGRDDGKNEGEHSAIFYRLKRFTLLTHGDFWLSETPDRPSKGWDAHCCNRLASWVRLRDKTSSKTLLVVSVHFDHEGEVARRESAKLLLHWLAGQKNNDGIIALGDFNSTPDTVQIMAMKAAMRDSRAVSITPAYGPMASFNDFKFGIVPSKLIDYIFLGPNIKVLKYAVLTDSDGQRYPSDHFPVLARIEME